MQLAFGVVPVKVSADVSVTSPISAEGVVRFNRRLEVHRMLLANILDTKIVHHKGEPDRAPIMHPQAWDGFALSVTMIYEPFLKQDIGNETCMWQTIHAKDSFDVHVTIRFENVEEFVLLNDFVRILLRHMWMNSGYLRGVLHKS